MQEFNFDLNKVELSTSIEPGEYRAIITDIKDNQTSSNGNPMITLSYEIILPEQYQGRILTERLAITDKSLWRVKKLYLAAKAMNAEGQFPIPFIPKANLIDKVLYIVCTKERYEKNDGTYGETTKITDYKGVSDSAGNLVVNATGTDDIPF
jgi:hypothetical protein